MKKIPTMFLRDTKKNKIKNEGNPDCYWVFNGQGVATRKYDGTCCMIDSDGNYYKRRQIKSGNKKPDNFILCENDDVSGKSFGWVPVDPNSKEDRYHMMAFKESLPQGTYELVGPKIQGNPEQVATHFLIKHSDAEVLSDVPRTFKGLKKFMNNFAHEGIVFHHQDGRMAKIKRKDFY